MLGKMDYEIRKWKPEDAYALSKILNNNKITDNLRDGIPCPYTDPAPFSSFSKQNLF